MCASARPTDDVVWRVRAEYLEMPGLGLTVGQAQRLFNLDQSLCDALLAALVDAGFLRRTPDGRYVRFN